MDNAEINNIIKIMGFKYNKKYDNDDDLKTLRYGKVMIMTDQVYIVRQKISYPIPSKRPRKRYRLACVVRQSVIKFKNWL